LEKLTPRGHDDWPDKRRSVDRGSATSQIVAYTEGELCSNPGGARERYFVISVAPRLVSVPAHAQSAVCAFTSQVVPANPRPVPKHLATTEDLSARGSDGEHPAYLGAMTVLGGSKSPAIAGMVSPRL